ncbi:MAG: hypothetical protein MHM6MM_006271 [Cercozoa sp. M6MM]
MESSMERVSELLKQEEKRHVNAEVIDEVQSILESTLDGYTESMWTRDSAEQVSQFLMEPLQSRLFLQVKDSTELLISDSHECLQSAESNPVLYILRRDQQTGLTLSDFDAHFLHGVVSASMETTLRNFASSLLQRSGEEMQTHLIRLLAELSGSETIFVPPEDYLKLAIERSVAGNTERRHVLEVIAKLWQNFVKGVILTSSASLDEQEVSLLVEFWKKRVATLQQLRQVLQSELIVAVVKELERTKSQSVAQFQLLEASLSETCQVARTNLELTSVLLESCQQDIHQCENLSALTYQKIQKLLDVCRFVCNYPTFKTPERQIRIVRACIGEIRKRCARDFAIDALLNPQDEHALSELSQVWRIREDISNNLMQLKRLEKSWEWPLTSVLAQFDSYATVVSDVRQLAQSALQFSPDERLKQYTLVYDFMKKLRVAFVNAAQQTIKASPKQTVFEIDWTIALEKSRQLEQRFVETLEERCLTEQSVPLLRRTRLAVLCARRAKTDTLKADLDGLLSSLINHNRAAIDDIGQQFEKMKASQSTLFMSTDAFTPTIVSAVRVTESFRAALEKVSDSLESIEKDAIFHRLTEHTAASLSLVLRKSEKLDEALDAFIQDTFAEWKDEVDKRQEEDRYLMVRIENGFLRNNFPLETYTFLETAVQFNKLKSVALPFSATEVIKAHREFLLTKAQYNTLRRKFRDDLEVRLFSPMLAELDGKLRAGVSKLQYKESSGTVQRAFLRNATRSCESCLSLVSRFQKERRKQLKLLRDIGALRFTQEAHSMLTVAELQKEQDTRIDESIELLQELREEVFASLTKQVTFIKLTPFWKEYVQSIDALFVGAITNSIHFSYEILEGMLQEKDHPVLQMRLRLNSRLHRIEFAGQGSPNLLMSTITTVCRRVLGNTQHLGLFLPEFGGQDTQSLFEIVSGNANVVKTFARLTSRVAEIKVALTKEVHDFGLRFVEPCFAEQATSKLPSRATLTQRKEHFAQQREAALRMIDLRMSLRREPHDVTVGVVSISQKVVINALIRLCLDQERALLEAMSAVVRRELQASLGLFAESLEFPKEKHTDSSAVHAQAQRLVTLEKRLQLATQEWLPTATLQLEQLRQFEGADLDKQLETLQQEAQVAAVTFSKNLQAARQLNDKLMLQASTKIDSEQNDQDFETTGQEQTKATSLESH